jgi:hypothetical protein
MLSRLRASVSAAQGGGTAVLPSGATLGMNANIAEAGAANTANSLAQINLNNAALGRQNWTQAAGVLAGSPERVRRSQLV